MPSTNSNWTLQQKVKALEKEVRTLKAVVEQLKPMAQVYGTYKGHDNRDVPCVITNAFPKVGTIDIVVFDNLYSGGKTEITCELGEEKGQANPYLSAKELEIEEDEAEEEPIELLAAK